MKKTLLLLALLAILPAANASHPVGGGQPNMAIDSSTCYSWSGGGASWTRCAPVLQPPVTVEKIVYVDRPVVVEKIVEKVVPVPAQTTQWSDKPIAE